MKMEAENASIFSKVLYMENKDLYDRLSELAAGDNVPLHMPGHKRNTDIFSMSNPYGIDITEIDGFDNLHNADGIRKDICHYNHNLHVRNNSKWLPLF